MGKMVCHLGLTGEWYEEVVKAETSILIVTAQRNQVSVLKDYRPGLTRQDFEPCPFVLGTMP